MLKTLGIHSNVTGEASLAEGHAWLTLHFDNGNSTTIGLWTTTFDTRRFIKDPTGFMLGETLDVEFGIEARNGYVSKASRYYSLTNDQAAVATKILVSNANWRFSHTCASWATEVVHQLTGEELESTELLGLTNTPRALGTAILELEAKQPTTPSMPKVVTGNAIEGASFPSARSSH